MRETEQRGDFETRWSNGEKESKREEVEKKNKGKRSREFWKERREKIRCGGRTEGRSTAAYPWTSCVVVCHPSNATTFKLTPLRDNQKEETVKKETKGKRRRNIGRIIKIARSETITFQGSVKVLQCNWGTWVNFFYFVSVQSSTDVEALESDAKYDV